jgi:hypothetical protein
VGNLNPYVTLGTGVQNIEIDGGTDFDHMLAWFKKLSLNGQDCTSERKHL